MSFKQNIFFFTFLSFLIVLFSFISELIAIFLSIILGFIIIKRAKIDGLICVFILYIIKQNFYFVVDYESMGKVTESDFIREELTVFGFPINLPTLVCFFVPMRVIYEYIFNKKTFSRHKLIFNLWLIALFPAIISFIISFVYHEPNWTRGFRFFLLSSSFFYGLILAKDFTELKFKVFIYYLLGATVLVISLITISVFWSHLVFLYIGLAVSFSIYFISRSSYLYKFFGFLLLFFSILFLLNATITILLIGLISFSLTIGTLNHGSINSRNNFNFVNLSRYFLLSISIISPFIFIYIGNKLGINVGYVDLNSNSDFSSRLAQKILFDRYPFWVSAFYQLIDGPFFFVHSGRPLLVNGLNSQFEWTVGAHNVVLEVLRNTGILVGSIILIIYFYALNANFNILNKSKRSYLKVISSAVIGVAISGIITGDFPADMTVGFFLWSFSGMLVGVNEIEEKSLSGV